MIGMVLVTHGRLADEFIAALEHIVGKQKGVRGICIGAEDDMEKRRKEILDSVASVEEGLARTLGIQVGNRLDFRIAGQELAILDDARFPVGMADHLVDAHVAIHCLLRDELGAPEFYTGGGKLVFVGGAMAKVGADVLAQAVRAGMRDEHTVRPAAVSLSQATERGAIYRPEEVRVMAKIAP